MLTKPSPCALSCNSWSWPKDDGPCSCGAKKPPRILPQEPEHGWSPYIMGQAYIQKKYNGL